MQKKKFVNELCLISIFLFKKTMQIHLLHFTKNYRILISFILLDFIILFLDLF